MQIQRPIIASREGQRTKKRENGSPTFVGSEPIESTPPAAAGNFACGTKIQSVPFSFCNLRSLILPHRGWWGRDWRRRFLTFIFLWLVKVFFFSNSNCLVRNWQKRVWNFKMWPRKDYSYLVPCEKRRKEMKTLIWWWWWGGQVFGMEYPGRRRAYGRVDTQHFTTECKQRGPASA